VVSAGLLVGLGRLAGGDGGVPFGEDGFGAMQGGVADAGFAAEVGLGELAVGVLGWPASSRFMASCSAVAVRGETSWAAGLVMGWPFGARCGCRRVRG
jgi:hypothetical protein